jgi:histidine triad (HIT) family protein
MATIFTRIINREIPAIIVAEDDNYLAFLDINPLREGHTLVIPKVEIDYIFGLNDNTLAGLMSFSKKVALGIEKAIPCSRIGIAVVGLEVPHAHIHLIPINSIHDMNFHNPKLILSKERLEEIGNLIKNNIL